MIVTLTQPLPTTGDLIQASDVSSPITDILAALNGGIDSDNLAANSVGTSELVDGSVTEAKLSASYFLGWNTSGLIAPTTVTPNGNRSYTLVFNGQDYTQELSEGMRLKFTRTVTAPTQSTSLNGSTQYWSKSSPNKMTFTDDFACSAWVYLTSYAAGTICSRFNGTSGWAFVVDPNGRLQILGYNAGGVNFSEVKSFQSMPLNRWVHVAAQLDMSAFTASATTSYTMMDGVDVPGVVARGGTNPTALVQAGDFQVGALNATNFFPGKIAQVAVYNTKVAQATIVATMHQALTGSETSLASGYSFNGAATDLNTTTPNDLSAVATASYTADAPFANGNRTYDTAGTTEYAIVMAKPTFSTNTTVTVQVPEGCTIPTSGGVSTVGYSSQRAPYGFPADRNRWIVESLTRVSTTQGAPVSTTWYNIAGTRLFIPIGAWFVNNKGGLYSDRGGAGPLGASISLSTSTTTETNRDFGLSGYQGNDTGFIMPYDISGPLQLASATTYYKISRTTQTSGANLQDTGGDATSIIRAYPTAL